MGEDAEILQFPNIPEQGGRVADFRGTYKDMKTDRHGNLVLQFVIPKNEKYSALPVTDYPGLVLRIICKREVIVYTKEIEDEMRALGLDEFRGDDG